MSRVLARTKSRFPFMRVSAGAAFTVQETYHPKRPSWSAGVEDNSGESSIQANPNRGRKA
jgi:hypothetical protein